MTTAHKVESETKEACNKVRARSAMTTELVDGSTELCNQTTRLMAALTRAEQGNFPASTPNSPRQRLWEGMDRQEHSYLPLLPQWPNWHGAGHLHLQCLSWPWHRNHFHWKPGTKCPGFQAGTSNSKEPSSLQSFRCQGWGHMAHKCTTLAKSLNPSRGNWGNVAQLLTGNSQQ